MKTYLYCEYSRSTSLRHRVATANAEIYFEQEEDQRFEIFPVTLGDVEIPSIAVLVEAQKANSLRAWSAPAAGSPQTNLYIDRNGMLGRKQSIDACLQNFVPTRLRRAVLFNNHNPVPTGHPGSRRMNETMRRTYYWSNLANDVYWKVEECIGRRRNCLTCRYLRRLQHFSTFCFWNLLRWIFWVLCKNCWRETDSTLW